MGRQEDLQNEYYVAMMNGPVGRFGRYLMDRSFDVGMRTAMNDAKGEKPLGNDSHVAEVLSKLSEEQREAVVKVVRSALIEAIHGLLHGLSHDEDVIRLEFEGHDVASLSDGLHGDLFDWLRDLSEYPYDFAKENGPFHLGSSSAGDPSQEDG